MREGSPTTAKLINSAITSLDGHVADQKGNSDRSAPNLYGRRMYEVMVYWETAHTVEGQPSFLQDFTEIWQGADKIVYSRTLETGSATAWFTDTTAPGPEVAGCDRTRIEQVPCISA